jgi:hypothetical protein
MQIRNAISTTLAVVALVGVSLTAAACHHHHHRGPAERAGAKIDHAADRAGDHIEDAGRKINRALPGD